jgi:hypothetical protein
MIIRIGSNTGVHYILMVIAITILRKTINDGRTAHRGKYDLSLHKAPFGPTWFINLSRHPISSL